MALILAGGAARGAYEVGVVQYILKEIARDLGRDLPLDILCGTSVGAINACMLAAHAHEPSLRADKLAHTWKELKLDQVARPSRTELFGLVGGMFGRKRSPPSDGAQRRGGLFDPRGVELIVRRGMPPGAIRKNLQARRLSALTVSTTNVGTGKTVIFVERSEPGLPPWSQDPTIVVRATEITAEHALASAAVPPLFPAVRLDGDFYCDGGLRQNVPLSPARRLGADGLIVVNPRHIPDEPLAPRAEITKDNETEYPGPFFLLGKAMNALLLDRIDNDIDRLNRINIILEAGTRRFGAKFVDELNQELGTKGRLKGFRPLRVVHIRASQDIGLMAAEYARSPEFGARSSGVWGDSYAASANGAPAKRTFSPTSSSTVSSPRVSSSSAAATRRARHDELCAFFEAIAPASGAKAQGSRPSEQGRLLLGSELELVAVLCPASRTTPFHELVAVPVGGPRQTPSVPGADQRVVRLGGRRGRTALDAFMTGLVRGGLFIGRVVVAPHRSHLRWFRGPRQVRCLASHHTAPCAVIRYEKSRICERDKH